MSAQSYIKLWTAEPSEHDEVQAYDLLSYEYDFRKPTTPCGQAVGKTTGGQMQVSIAGFPSKELLEWMFNSRILKRGGDEHLGKAGDTEGNHPVQGSPMSGFPCAFDRERELYLAAYPFRGNGSRRFVSPKFEMRL